MKTEINSPLGSKVNWTSFIALILTVVINILAIYEIIPTAVAVQLLTLTGTVSYLVVIMWRSLFTDPKPEMGP